MARKRYWYKVYKRGEFKGLLPDPIDEFGYSQDINTPFAQLTIRLAKTLNDAGAQELTETIDDHDGLPITDHNDEPLLSSLEYVFNTVPIDLGNRVVVYMSYDGAINGKVVFDGIITTWSSDVNSGATTLTVLSNGVQLDNYLVSTPAGSTLADQSLSVTHSYSLYYDGPGLSTSLYTSFAQTFTLSVTSSVSSFSFALRKSFTYTGPQVATVVLRVGAPDGSGQVLSVTSRTVTGTATGWVWHRFTFPTPVTLSSGVLYSATITLQYQPIDYPVLLGLRIDNPYSGGNAYRYTASTGWVSEPTYDFHFQVIAAGANLERQFLSTDPSNVLRAVLDDYRQAGGIISYDSTSIDDTHTEVSYTFKSASVYDAARKVLELAPANWYWYVDPATNLFHFHRLKTVPDHIFYSGKHLTELTVEQTLEDMKNYVIFSGGDGGSGTNLVRQRINTNSIAKYGRWLDRPSDLRVTVPDTADTIVRSTLNQRRSPVFRTTVEMSSANYDIETIDLGSIASFRSFDSFTNSLALQVAGFTRRPTTISLRLATSPPAVAHRIEDIRRNLDTVMTQNNPNSA